MKSADQSRLNFLKLINYPTIYGGQQGVQNRYDPPLPCGGVCVLCERAMFADGSRSEIGGNIASDYLSKISHAADTADLETILGPLPLPNGAEYIHARVFFVFEAPNKGEGSDTSWGKLYPFHDIRKHLPCHHYYWSCPKQDWPEGWPEGEEDLLRHAWAGWVPYGGYLAYLINRYHLKDAYITNAIKCGKASGAYDFTRGSTDEKVLGNCTTAFLKEEIRLTPPKVIFPFGDRATQICKRAGLRPVEGLWHPRARGKNPRELIRHNDALIKPALRNAGLLSGSIGPRDAHPRPDSHVPEPRREAAELATGSGETGSSLQPSESDEEFRSSVVYRFTRKLKKDLEEILGTEWEIYNEFKLPDNRWKKYRAFEMWKHTWKHTWHDTGTWHDTFRWRDKLSIGMVSLEHGPGRFRIGVIKGPHRLANMVALQAFKAPLDRTLGESWTYTPKGWWVWGVPVDERYSDWNTADVEARLRQGDEALAYFRDYFLRLIRVVGPEIDRELGLR